MSAHDELNQYFETQIKGALLQLVRDQDGWFRLQVDDDTSRDLDGILQGHGLHVYGMAVTPDQLEITFELGGKYPQIPNLPIRHFRVSFENEGQYYVDIDEDIVNKDLWIRFGDAVLDFSKCSEEEMAKLVHATKQAHLLYVLSS